MFVDPLIMLGIIPELVNAKYILAQSNSPLLKILCNIYLKSETGESRVLKLPTILVWRPIYDFR